MKVEKKRFFVGNLPPSSTEELLVKKFKKYGNVLSVELKRRPDNSTFAFLDLEINPKDVESCLHGVSRKSWDGFDIKVELAKESFLSRLERERELAKIKSVDNPVQREVVESVSSSCSKKKKKEDNSLNKFNDSKSSCKDLNSSKDEEEKNSQSSEEEEETDSDSSEDNDVSESKSEESSSKISHTKPVIEREMMQKFESFSDVWKDTDDETQSITDPHKSGLKIKENKKDHRQIKESLSKHNSPEKLGKEINQHEKNIVAEEKRLKSIAERKKLFLEQKQAVKNALTRIDSTARSNKKIIFARDEDEMSNVLNSGKMKMNSSDMLQSPSKIKKEKLFSDDESEAEVDDFKIKSQFEGPKGQKLLELQARYANDKRFTLDERFLESDDDAEEKPIIKPDDVQDEKKQQLRILGSILGQELQSYEDKNIKHKRKTMLRFDPTKPDHVKYEVKQSVDDSTGEGQNGSMLEEEKPNKRKKKDKSETTKRGEPLPKVSSEKYYEVSDALKDSFKSKGEGFSLLEMFGSNNSESIDNEYEDVEHKNYQNKKQIGWSMNPFKYDSSESEDEQVQKPKITDSSLTEHHETWHESFFFTPDDTRLKEGLQFFKQKIEDEDNFAAKRRELKQIIRSKIRNNQKKKLTWKKKLGGKKIAGKKHSKFHENKGKHRFK